MNFKNYLVLIILFTFFVFQIVECSDTVGTNDIITDSTDITTFSVPGGIYTKAPKISMVCTNKLNKIFYTLDGTKPTIKSIEYKGDTLTLNNSMCTNADIFKIQISPVYLYHPPKHYILKCIVIRAACFDNTGIQVSPVTTHSYFIKELGIDHNSLPIVSINAEYDDLFDFEKGILVPGIHFNPLDSIWTGNYHQRGDSWERQIHIEYFEPESNSGFSQECGLRAHGGFGRVTPQKGLKLYARSEYGESRFRFPIFSEKSIKSYKRLVLRSFMSSWSQAGITDHLCNQIASKTKSGYTASKPIILYLNGEYWGIYFLQERIDDEYIKSNYNPDSDSIDLISSWYGFTDEGNNENYLKLYNFIKMNDLKIQSNYRIVEKWMDINNFIDYQLLEIFIANTDWPSGNIRFWRERCERAKWRWIFFDGDASFGSSSFNGFENALDTSDQNYPTNAFFTLFLRKLLENNTFRNKYYLALERLLINAFNKDLTNQYLDDVVYKIDDEIDNQINRFLYPDSKEFWLKKIDHIKLFLDNRTCEVVMQVKEMYNLNIHSKDCNVATDSLLPLLVVCPIPAVDYLEVFIPDSLEIEIDKDEIKGTILIQIFNIFGTEVIPPDSKRLFYTEGIGERINVSHLAPGVYFIKFGNRMAKFVKM